MRVLAQAPPKQTWSFQMCSLSLEISSTVSPINAISMFKRRTKVSTTKVMRSRRNRTGYLEFCWISRSPSPRVSLKRSIRTGPRLLLEWHSPPSWHVSIRAARAEKKAQGNFSHNHYLGVQGISPQRIPTAKRARAAQAHRAARWQFQEAQGAHIPHPNEIPEIWERGKWLICSHLNLI